MNGALAWSALEDNGRFQRQGNGLAHPQGPVMSIDCQLRAGKLVRARQPPAGVGCGYVR